MSALDLLAATCIAGPMHNTWFYAVDDFDLALRASRAGDYHATEALP